MNVYRFSPIKDFNELVDAINHIHIECYKLCMRSFGKYLSNAENIGVFCHFDDEFENLKVLRQQITKPSNNPDQKYFELYEPIIIPAKDDVSETVYKYLYIRRPDPKTPEVGDIDFYMEDSEFQSIKQSLIDGKVISGARIYDRPDLDMIELYDKNIDVLAYVSTKTMTQKVRIKLSDVTKL